VVARESFATERHALEKALSKFPGAKVLLEAGSQSPWMSRVLSACGYDVQVADPRRVQLISKDRGRRIGGTPSCWRRWAPRCPTCWAAFTTAALRRRRTSRWFVRETS
jgi:hypothetical protein